MTGSRRDSIEAHLKRVMLDAIGFRAARRIFWRYEFPDRFGASAAPAKRPGGESGPLRTLARPAIDELQVLWYAAAFSSAFEDKGLGRAALPAPISTIMPRRRCIRRRARRCAALDAVPAMPLRSMRRPRRPAAIETARMAVAGLRRSAGQDDRLHFGRHRGAQSGADAALAAGAGEAPFDLLLVGAGRTCRRVRRPSFSGRRGRDCPLTPTASSTSARSSRAWTMHGARVCWRCRPPITRPASSSRSPRRRASFMPPAASLVCDAVQAGGQRIDCDMARLEADMLISRRINLADRKGAGALCFAERRLHIGEAMIRGGGQERGRAPEPRMSRPSPALARRPRRRGGLDGGRARVLAGCATVSKRASRHRAGCGFFREGRARLPNTSCFAVPGMEPKLLLMVLDLEGVAVSSGSACSSGKVKPRMC